MIADLLTLAGYMIPNPKAIASEEEKETFVLFAFLFMFNYFKPKL